MGWPKIYPLVQLIIKPTDYARSKFGPSGPTGVTVHYTADGSVQGAIDSFAKDGYCYHLIIGRDGKVTQTCYMDSGTWHAGKALWLGQSPNKSHIAVALVSWGWLEPDGLGGWESYAKTKVPGNEVAFRPSNLNAKQQAWHAATPEQETALDHVLLWAITNGISPDAICGHDEAALPLGRKSDPGGVLSRTMPELRAHLVSSSSA